MTSIDLRAATWRKSSHSGANGGDCIEVAPGFRHVVPVRDSKNPGGPALIFPADAFASFVNAVRTGEFETV